MCLQVAEYANHFFLHYEVAEALMNRCLQLAGVCWVIPFSLQDAIVQWKLLFISKRAKAIWNIPLHAILWVFGWNVTIAYSRTSGMAVNLFGLP